MCVCVIHQRSFLQSTTARGMRGESRVLIYNRRRVFTPTNNPPVQIYQDPQGQLPNSIEYAQKSTRYAPTKSCLKFKPRLNTASLIPDNRASRSRSDVQLPTSSNLRPVPTFTFTVIVRRAVDPDRIFEALRSKNLERTSREALLACSCSRPVDSLLPRV